MQFYHPNATAFLIYFSPLDTWQYWRPNDTKLCWVNECLSVVLRENMGGWENGVMTGHLVESLSYRINNLHVADGTTFNGGIMEGLGQEHLKPDLPEFKSQLCHLLCVSPRVSHITFLCLSFPSFVRWDWKQYLVGKVVRAWLSRSPWSIYNSSWYLLRANNSPNRRWRYPHFSMHTNCHNSSLGITVVGTRQRKHVFCS